MFYDDETEPLPWDYFLTHYEQDLLTLTFGEVISKNPDKTTDEIHADFEQIAANQATFIGRYRKVGTPLAKPYYERVLNYVKSKLTG